jgi:hypothetical protein
MEDIIKIDGEQRKSLFNQYAKHDSASNAINRKYGTLADAESIHLLEMNNLIKARKNTKPLRFTINQMLRIHSTDNKDYLKIQTFVHIPTDQGHSKTYSIDSLGLYLWPVFEPAISGYSATTGLPIESGYSLNMIEERKTIPCTAEQVEALSQHFSPEISLIVKDRTRKYTVSNIEQFVGNYKDTIAALSDFDKRIEDRLLNVLKSQLGTVKT